MTHLAAYARLAGPLLLACVPALPAGAQPPVLPAPPQITLAEGAELISLARSAMHLYVRRRTPADDQPIPASLKRLRKRSYTAALSLRDKGERLAREIDGHADLPRNVIAAALRAIRSPKLPDRVTRDYLDTLTVELEVLGGPRPVAENALARAIVPGHTGLLLRRGDRTAYALASAAVVLNLGAQDMRRLCLSRLGLHRREMSLPPQWAIFTSRHYVGYPDGQLKWLQRGKILVPEEAIDEELLASAALRVAAHLVAAQGEDGQYRPAREPAAFMASAPGTGLLDHLYATWVLARLARRRAAGPRRGLSASVQRALAYAARTVRRDEATGRAYVATRAPGNELAATALLALALGEAPAGERGRTRQEELLAAVLAARGDDGRLSCRLGGAEAQSRPAAVRLKHAAWAWLAVTAGLRGKRVDAAEAESFRKAVGTCARRPTGDGDVETTLWWLRAGLEVPGERATSRRVFPLPVAAGAGPETLRDERGGFAPPGGSPTTTITAWQAVVLAARLAEGARRPPTRPEALRRRCLAARRFCYQMMFKRHEAYFAARPDAWVGAVRAGPSSARVTLGACAAAIEAFEAK